MTTSEGGEMFKIWSSAEERETLVVTESQILPVPLLFSCHKVSRFPRGNVAVKIPVDSRTKQS